VRVSLRWRSRRGRVHQRLCAPAAPFVAAANQQDYCSPARYVAACCRCDSRHIRPSNRAENAARHARASLRERVDDLPGRPRSAGETANGIAGAPRKRQHGMAYESALRRRASLVGAGPPPLGPRGANLWAVLSIRPTPTGTMSSVLAGDAPSGSACRRGHWRGRDRNRRPAPRPDGARAAHVEWARGALLGLAPSRFPRAPHRTRRAPFVTHRALRRC